MNICAHDLLADATRRRDPTGTAFIQVRLVADLERRWRIFSDLVVRAVADEDVLALRGPSLASVRHAPTGDVVEGFRTLLDAAFRQTVLERDGAWLRPYFEQTAQMALRRANALSHAQGILRLSRTETVASTAASELRGIGAAVIQQCVRLAASAARGRTRPMLLARDLRARVRAVGVARSRAMVAHEVVSAFSLATLDALRSAGVRRVGTVPERMQRRAVKVRDADVDLENEVDVLTAGDDDVCEECQDISDEGPYDIDEADSLIPAHPFCRCAFVPASDERFASVHEEDT